MSLAVLVPVPEREPARMLAFDGFRVDPVRRMLLSHRKEQPLSENLFRLLMTLLESNGDVVSKRALCERVWPGEAVTRANLHQHIFLLRRILGENGREHSYIVNVPKKGYRFVHDVKVAEASCEPHQPARQSGVRDTTCSAALDSFCDGAILLDEPSQRSLRRAAEAFRVATEADSRFVPAHAGLGRAYAMLGFYGYLPASVARAQARSNLTRARRIDPNSPHVAVLSAELGLLYEGDGDTARILLTQALRSNPRATWIRATWIKHLILSGNEAHALEEAETLVEATPEMHACVLRAYALMNAGYADRAIEVLTKLISARPDVIAARFYRAQALFLTENWREAAAECERLRAVTGESYPIQRTQQYVSNWSRALETARDDRIAECITWLERAAADREPALLLLNTRFGAACFAPLRNVPAFETIVEQLRSKRRDAPART